ncbi:MAG: Rpn family recombination-promoting nuclease/putative transposase [Nannocystaceae bacterium]
MDRLDPTLDLVFKLLLTRKPELLRNMLEGILAAPIAELTILNPDLPGELTSDKEIVLDIRVRLDNGSRVDLEMQIRTAPALPSRLVYYGARDYADQLGRGDDYHLLTPTIVIVWLVEPLFPALDRLHSIFELRERHTHTLFGDQLAIHVLQLSSLTPTHATGYTGRVERWGRFLTARNDAELLRLASEDPIMTTAKDTLDDLSQDPAAHRLARERSDAKKLYRLDLLASEAKGEARGEAKVLLKQLTLRFGPLPESTRARIESATIEQLDAWTERVLTAPTLDEVLGDGAP